jgi:transposase
METAERTFGVIVLETTHDGVPEEIYNYYKDRWGIETFYAYLKHQMDFNALGVQDWAKLQGLAFMMLLSALINGTIQEKLKQSSLSGIYMPEVLLTASSVKAMKRNELWTIENTTKRESDLFQALSVPVGAELKPASFALPT